MIGSVTFSEINWEDPANWFRMATLLIETGLLMEFVLMLSHYYWRIIPLRKTLKDEMTILTPPIRWTFAYHSMVTALVAMVWISTLQRLAFHDPHATVSTWLSPFVALGLWVCVRQFTKYYSKDLNQAEQDHLH